MAFRKARTTDTIQEKCVFSIEKISDNYLVKVGQNITHLKKEKQSIEWTKLLAVNQEFWKELNPGYEPEGLFPLEVPHV